jgi:hypothetical protein
MSDFGTSMPSDGGATASLAGDRTAWLENTGTRQWLVEGAVIPVLERG